MKELGTTDKVSHGPGLGYCEQCRAVWKTSCIFEGHDVFWVPQGVVVVFKEEEVP